MSNMIVLYRPTGCQSANAIGTPNDRGCVRCRGTANPDLPGDFVFDDRGRYWHVRCAVITLGEFTRFQETRATAHYRYEFTEDSR